MTLYADVRYQAALCAEKYLSIADGWEASAENYAHRESVAGDCIRVHMLAYCTARAFVRIAAMHDHAIAARIVDGYRGDANDAAAMVMAYERASVARLGDAISQANHAIRMLEFSIA